jgi:hypothetical protein
MSVTHVKSELGGALADPEDPKLGDAFLSTWRRRHRCRCWCRCRARWLYESGAKAARVSSSILSIARYVHSKRTASGSRVTVLPRPDQEQRPFCLSLFL